MGSHNISSVSLDNVESRVWARKTSRAISFTAMLAGMAAFGGAMTAYKYHRYMIPAKAVAAGGMSVSVFFVAARSFFNKGYSPATDIADYIASVLDNSNELSEEANEAIQECLKGEKSLKLLKQHIPHAADIISKFKDLKRLEVRCLPEGPSPAKLLSSMNVLHLDFLRISGLAGIDDASVVNDDPTKVKELLVLNNCQICFENRVASEWVQRIQCDRLEVDTLELGAVSYFDKFKSVTVRCPAEGGKGIPDNMSAMKAMTTLDCIGFPHTIPEGVNSLSQCPALKTVTFFPPQKSAGFKAFRDIIDEFERDNSPGDFLTNFTRVNKKPQWDAQRKSYYVKYERNAVQAAK